MFVECLFVVCCLDVPSAGLSCNLVLFSYTLCPEKSTILFLTIIVVIFDRF